MGKRILSFPWTLALKIPLSWVLKISVSLRLNRIALNPNAGFNSLLFE
jgi:hypothetical protein